MIEGETKGWKCRPCQVANDKKKEEEEQKKKEEVMQREEEIEIERKERMESWSGHKKCGCIALLKQPWT